MWIVDIVDIAAPESGGRQEGEAETVLSLVRSCSFTRNNADTGAVCDRIQVAGSRYFYLGDRYFTRTDIYCLQGIYNEHGVCLTVNNIDISINSSTLPENVNSSILCKNIMCNLQ